MLIQEAVQDAFRDWAKIHHLILRKSKSGQVPSKLTLIKPSVASVTENTTANLNNLTTVEKT